MHREHKRFGATLHNDYVLEYFSSSSFILAKLLTEGLSLLFFFRYFLQNSLSLFQRISIITIELIRAERESLVLQMFPRLVSDLRYDLKDDNKQKSEDAIE